VRRLALALSFLLLAAPAHARERAPGAPGEPARWAQADKHGFGTSATRASRVWFTLRQTELTEVYFPDLSHPAVRSLAFTVDGRPVKTGRVTNDALTYTQTSRTKAFTLTRTYVTDPERSTLLIKVRLDSRDGEEHSVEVHFDPHLSGDGNDDVGWSRGRALLAHDHRIASALVAEPALTRTSSGYKGRSEATLLEHTYDALRPGNVVQQAHTRLTGRGRAKDMTVALAFAPTASAALETARATLERGWDDTAARYRQGWTDYRNRLEPIPAAALPVAAAYETSLLLLKAHEDKQHRGAFIASPSRPWGQAPYHRVRVRDLYHVATALHAAGDRAAARRALGFLLGTQHDDGTFPAHVDVDGRRPGTARPEGLPIVLAHQLGAGRWSAVRKAADAILAQTRPRSSARLAAYVAGLICAADLARQRGANARAARYERKADAWQRRALELDGRDLEFLELVRLGVRRADDPAIVAALARADRRLKAGDFWRRGSDDPYGERSDGRGYRPDADGTRGRAWPLLAGERGEYELRAGRPANAFLQALAGAANDALILPEQVWDGRPPTGKDGFTAGRQTFSAAPLAWTHAQLVRLAWSIEARTPVELPQLVASRYG
jgi:glucoamylase